MQDRSINIGGSLHGVASTGDHAVVHTYSNSFSQISIVREVSDMLEDLAIRYPNIADNHRLVLFQVELQKKADQDPTLKQRFFNIVKSGGFELAKVLTNNPFVSVTIEMLKSWLDA
jgi:hypothetical protein